MRGLRVEPALNEFLERDPLAVEVKLAAPGAQPHELFEAMQPRDQSPRQHDDRNGDQKNDDRLEQALVPAAEMVGSEDQARQAQELVDP